MDRRAAVRAAVAGILWVPAEGLAADTPLGPALQGSLGQARLAAALRLALGSDVRPPAGLRTLGELEAAVCGADGTPVPPATPPATPPANWIATAGPVCGIDVESVAALPIVADYWEDEFYRSNFAPAEIAYCAAQAHPPMHFAARWCAKEALKKCAPAIVPGSFAAVELAERPEGGVGLRRAGGDWLPVTVSVAHTETLAVAVVVAMPPAAPAVTTAAPAIAAVRPSRLPLVVALVALAVAVAALALALRP
jgi:holo-[acyl-carrier protein] synthase